MFLNLNHTIKSIDNGHAKRLVELVFRLLNRNNCQFLYSTLLKEVKSDGEKKWVKEQCYRSSDKNEKNTWQFH